VASPDVTLTFHGSIDLITPLTEPATADDGLVIHGEE